MTPPTQPTRDPLACHSVLTAHDFGHLPEPARTAADTIALPYEGRLLRRKRLQTSAGRIVLLDLEKVTNLEHGGALALEDGSFARIEAAPEAVLVVTGENLPRIAWHIGNRHTPCQIEANHLIIQQDHVLAKMLVQLGAKVEEMMRPFNPEGGAYGHGRTFGHSHGPADHAHEHHE
ncbi:urease accessory protein UreE [Falsihalocynthiibacter sp. SS001]|uniref:urease accessory protein UreE n=1 Tax=Falsihalocynthiibacter sp. SS001 TaxID=3349698 RepID=UPI0036D3BD87